ncbi:MAG TPA: TIGR00268 family protein, partial [Phycisphaerae bacterium]|nr:TIGR00268 family protein [Phycisphaerae bacterium]
THDKPASPCLSSRIQYGEQITPEKLNQIDRSERFLRSLGFRECRVRHHNNLARIEVPADQIERLCSPEIRTQVDAALREFGYAYVTIDARGFRSGSMNEVIAFGKRQTI